MNYIYRSAIRQRSVCFATVNAFETWSFRAMAGIVVANDVGDQNAKI